MRRPAERQPTIEDFGRILKPAEALEPILAAPVRGALLEWLTEIFAEDELLELGVTARKRAIFDGPPGVGKTTLAHHLAARLGLPMLAVRPEKLIDAYVGSTGRNIGNLFDTVEAAEQPIVLFMDEFDAIGHKRRTNTGSGAEDERNAFVNTLLGRLEQFPGFFIAATNFGEHVDPAIWRRFEMHVSLLLPGPFERERILARYLLPLGVPEAALTLLGAAFEAASPALMRQFCEHLKRMIVIGPKLRMDMGKGAVFSRLTTTIQPHPDLGKPPMWATGANDHARDRAIAALPWPLPKASELDAEVVVAEAAGANVVPLGRRS